MSIPRRRLLDASEAKDFRQATKEWVCFGECFEDVKGTKSCDFCGKKGKYFFPVYNLYNGKVFLLSRSCLEDIQIRVLDEGSLVPNSRLRSFLRSKTRELRKLGRKRRAVLAIERLLLVEDFAERRKIVRSLKKKVFNDQPLSPKELNFLFWRLEKHKIPFKAKDFKVKLKGKKEIEKLLNLDSFQLDRIKAAMTPKQLKKHKNLF